MRVSAFLSGLLLALAGQAAPAQDIIRQAEPANDRIDEHFDRSGAGANVSGGVIVGAMLGAVSGGGFPADRILIATPPERVLLCLRALSRDGLFSARNPYRLTGLADGMEGTTLMPFTDGYADDLRRYADDEVAVIAMPADDQGRCRSGEPRLFPRVPPELALGETDLTLQVNTAGRGMAWVETGDGTRADCRPVEGGPAIGFDMTCRLRVPIGPGPAELGFVLWVDDGLQPQPSTHVLAIPGHEVQP